MFLGLREDKPARTVKRERAKPSLRAGVSSPKTNLTIGKQTVPVTNLDKVLWPEDGYTKGDLIAYYRAVCEVATAARAGPGR